MDDFYRERGFGGGSLPFGCLVCDWHIHESDGWNDRGGDHENDCRYQSIMK